MALRGVKVVEMLGLAPGPLCGTILADFGASVTVVQKIQANPFDVLSNGKKILPVDLKTEEGVDIVRKLCNTSDVLLDTFRPGVMEKLGLGPESLCKTNTRLVYARLTGYGQHGFYAHKAGHDINYIGMSGILSLLAKKQHPPSPPLNLMADFAGGSLICAFGIMLALYERMQSGKGQVVDCSMTEGAAYVGTWLFKSKHLPIWTGEPGTNILDGGSHFYRTYRTKDDKFMAVGALEPQFYSNLLQGLQLSGNEYSQTHDAENCMKKFEEVFLQKTQDEWVNIFENLDACVTPVLDLNSVGNHPCHKSRNSFFENVNEDVNVPEAAPKLSRTPGHTVSRSPQPKPGQHTIEILQELGYKDEEIRKLIEKGLVHTHRKSNL